MRTGMLWFDNDPKASVGEKIKKAAGYYERKYGLRPTVCFIHPAHLSGELAIEGMTIEPSRQVLRNHIWMGVKDG